MQAHTTQSRAVWTPPALAQPAPHSTPPTPTSPTDDPALRNGSPKPAPTLPRCRTLTPTHFVPTYLARHAQPAPTAAPPWHDLPYQPPPSLAHRPAHAQPSPPERTPRSCHLLSQPAHQSAPARTSQPCPQHVSPPLRISLLNHVPHLPTPSSARTARTALALTEHESRKPRTKATGAECVAATLGNNGAEPSENLYVDAVTSISIVQGTDATSICSAALGPGSVTACAPASCGAPAQLSVHERTPPPGAV
nr:extensin-like [Salvelinus alpinus]